MKVKLGLFVCAILCMCCQVAIYSQQVYLIQGKIISTDSLVKQFLGEESIKQIDSLSNHVDEGLSSKEKREYLLHLQLLKVGVYDYEYELNKALPILLDVLEKAKDDNFNRIIARAYILLSSIKSKGNDLAESAEYIRLAKKQIEENSFDDLYGAYYYQKSSIHRLKAEFDSVRYNANKALEYGHKYKNEEDIALAHTMLGTASDPDTSGREKEMLQAIYHYNQSIPYYKKVGNYTHLAIMYRNISREYFRHNLAEQSFLYIDSAYLYYDKMNYFYKEQLPLMKFDLHYSYGDKDSAIQYLMAFHNVSFATVTYRESNKIKDITEKYQNDEKEAVIKNKNQWIIFIASILLIIVIATTLLIRSNQRIKSQNKIISKQVEDLVKTLEQKQVLLSELQHRVKNNLQHVISILEIQKESVNFNNIDELIRGNQNRIHSMALLHKKLNVSDNVNEVDLKRYIKELSELVKDSYGSHKKNVQLTVNCAIETISIEKALPLGLIIVELVSNSMKHAFKKRSVGIITIEIKKDAVSGKNTLCYTDNGTGFDFNRTTSKGLGLEIIKGLIDQLDGEVETHNNQGFELSMSFK